MIDRNEIVSALTAGVVEVDFTKVNGENRIMECTLSERIVPFTESKSTASRPDNVLAVWDINNSGWRSFRLENVNSWKVKEYANA